MGWKKKFKKGSKRTARAAGWMTLAAVVVDSLENDAQRMRARTAELRNQELQARLAVATMPRVVVSRNTTRDRHWADYLRYKEMAADARAYGDLYDARRYDRWAEDELSAYRRA